MLDPHYLQHIADGAENIASQLHEYIIRQIVDRMMIRIGRGDDYLLTSSDAWRIQVLQDSGYLLQDITAELTKYTKRQEKEIKAAMEEAGVKALEYDDKIYQAAGLSPMPLTQSPALIRLMERNYNATLGEWRNMTRSTAEAAQRLFINECDFAYNKVTSGATSYSQAVREAVETVASGGVYVDYPSGYRDTVEVAVARAVRTGIAQATGDIQIARMMEMGYANVLTSSHFGARPTHEVWQGGRYSIDWDKLKGRRPELFFNLSPSVKLLRDNKYPDFIDVCRYTYADGICGANCRHHFSVYIEGMNNPFKKFDSEENRKMYKKEQRQRALERRVRKTKREVMGLQEAVEKCQDEATKFEVQQALDRKSYLLSKQNRAYSEFCKANDLRSLNERLQIASWNREQAAKARGAARRYQNAKGV